MVKIKSLPFDATQLDIIHFFEQFKLKPNGVQLVVRSDNRATGEVSDANSAPCGREVEPRSSRTVKATHVFSLNDPVSGSRQARFLKGTGAYTWVGGCMHIIAYMSQAGVRRLHKFAALTVCGHLACVPCFLSLSAVCLLVCLSVCVFVCLSVWNGGTRGGGGRKTGERV